MLCSAPYQRMLCSSWTSVDILLSLTGWRLVYIWRWLMGAAGPRLHQQWAFTPTSAGADGYRGVPDHLWQVPSILNSEHGDLLRPAAKFCFLSGTTLWHLHLPLVWFMHLDLTAMVSSAQENRTLTKTPILWRPVSSLEIFMELVSRTLFQLVQIPAT